MTQKYRTGDKVKFEGVVTGDEHADGAMFVQVPDDYQINNRGAWIRSEHLELVERPGPRLEDLPDGTVITIGNGSNPWEKHGHKLWRPDSTWLTENVDKPFTVIGAKPGTRAWELYLRGAERWGWLDVNEHEWWVTG